MSRICFALAIIGMCRLVCITTRKPARLPRPCNTNRTKVQLRLLLCQDIESHLVWFAIEVFEKGVLENLVVGGSSHEQGHAGPEFQIVGVGEDLFSASTIHVENKLRKCSEPGA